MRTILASCFLISVPFCSLAQETVPADNGVLQYVVPDPNIDIFAGEDTPQNDQIFIGIELEVLERRIATLEAENELLRARVDRMEAAIFQGGQ